MTGFKSNIQLVTLVFCALLLFAMPLSADGAENGKTGILRGKVVDSETSSALPGVSVHLSGTGSGALTDKEGNFIIRDVEIGNYTVRFNLIGYKPLSRTDVIIKSGRSIFIEAHLTETFLTEEDITVTAGYFAETEDQPVSTIGFSSEEIRRAPGSAGDVSRIVSGLPSIAKVDDQLNSLVVRGGSPSENAFFIDNIEIPNINHYPLQGSSGGPIGLLNVDFIENVNFSAGGFDAAYGNRLSSVMEIDFREGNRQEFDFQADVHMAGIGLTGEGPIVREKGSWMFSARKSMLDLLVDAIGTGVAPRYSDYQGKLAYDLSPSHSISILGIAGIDYIEFDREQSTDDGNVAYGTHDGYEYAAGMNWKYLWSKNGFSQTSVSYLATKYKGLFYETKSEMLLIDENSLEGAFQLRNVNFYRFNSRVSAEFGLEGKYYLNDYDFYQSEYTNPIGDTVPPLELGKEVETPIAGSFVNLSLKPLNRVNIVMGMRYDYFEYSENSHISPRISLSYNFNSKTSIHAAAGIYYQHLPLFLLSQNDDFRDLKSLKCNQYLLGLEHLLWKDTRLTIEGYFKDYRNYPLDPNMPASFIVDEMIYYGFYRNFDQLLDDGRARSYGIELTLQKKLVRGIYGLVGVSYSKSEYQPLDGIWRDRIFDNGLIVSIEGGYKPNRSWEYSLRWIYAGGTPYTPLDLQASQEINRSVIDRNRINELRKSDYHSLNLRVDRRFYFQNTNMIVYFSIWNAYNRENVSYHYWNEIEQKQDTIYQWSMLPVFGVEFEF